MRKMFLILYTTCLFISCADNTNPDNNDSTSTTTVSTGTTTTTIPFAPESIKGVQRSGNPLVFDYAVPSEYSDIPSRDIVVILPANYSNDNPSYTLYMHDAQNIFNKDSYGHGGWQADTTVNKLIADASIDQTIIVGIPHGGNRREYEYTDEDNGAPHYLSYIINRIIPVVEYNYNVIKSKSGRVICGSSFGGVISLYAVYHHGDTFGKVIAMSPCIWKSWLMPMVNSSPKPDVKIYIDVGSIEDRYMGYVGNLRNALVSKGFTEDKDLKYVYGMNQEHNEEAWRARLPGALFFILH